MRAIAQIVMKMQQDLAGFAIKGDAALESVFPPKDEKPDWATFDDDEQPAEEAPSPNGERKDIIRDSDVEIPDGAKEGTFNVIASPFEVGAEGVYEVIIGLTKGADRFEYVYKFAISDASRLQAEYEKAMAESGQAGN